MKEKTKITLSKLRIILIPLMLVAAVGVGIVGGMNINNKSSGEIKQVQFNLFDAKRKEETQKTIVGLEKKPIGTEKVPAILMTDGYGEIRDQSFYESSARGLNNIYGILNDGSDENRPSSGNKWFHQPRSGLTGKDLASEYSSIINSILGKETQTTGQTSTTLKKVIIAPGFNHKEAIYKWQTTNPTINDVRFLLLDHKAEFEKSDGTIEKLKNTLAISFDVRGAAFKAGLLSAAYLNLIGDEDPKVGFWGGNETSPVTDYLIGFTEGIKHYNSLTIKDKVDVKVVSFNTKEDFLNSGFESKDGRDKADFLVSNGADIILPVAAGQTIHAINAIYASERKSEIKLIGVDSDHVKTYPDDKNLFLTTITKELEEWVYNGYQRLTTGIKTKIATDFDATSNSLSVVLDMETNGTSYVKSFQDDLPTKESVMWNHLYKLVDDTPIPTTWLTWNETYNYITKK